MIALLPFRSSVMSTSSASLLPAFCEMKRLPLRKLIGDAMRKERLQRIEATDQEDRDGPWGPPEPALSPAGCGALLRPPGLGFRAAGRRRAQAPGTRDPHVLGHLVGADHEGRGDRLSAQRLQVGEHREPHSHPARYREGEC